MLLPQLLKQEGLVTVTVMVMMLMMVPDYSEGHTTCTAITTVYNTSVTCLFAEDISQLSFNVQFFFPNTSVDPEMLLACNRLISGGFTCHKGRQVLFDEKQKIADRFTLSRPPSLNKLNRGYYQCHAVPSLPERSQFCALTYKDVPRESLPPPPKDGTDVIHLFMLVAIVIILILLIVVISARFYLWTKRNRVALWCSRRAAEKKRPEDVKDATEDIPLRGLKTRIPEGVAQIYYNKGWKEALMDEKSRMTADEPSLRTLSAQPTGMAGEKESGEIQTVAAEEATAMVGEGEPETEEAPGSKKQPWYRRFFKFFWRESDTSEHGARGESEKGNTRAGKSSENERERQRQEKENRETRGGQESYEGETRGGQGSQGEEGADIQAKENQKKSETKATKKKKGPRK